jgi:hypothetical protein
MRPRRRRRHEAIVVIMLGGILLSVAAGFAWLVFVLAHFLVLVLTIAAVAVAYRLGQRHCPPVRVIQSRPADDPEAARLRAENARLHALASQLRREAQEATTSMHAAWDAASSVPPRPRPEPSTARTRLLGDPLAGAHELGGPR